jgi:hypothetical protein
MASPEQWSVTPPTIRLTVDALRWDSVSRSTVGALNYFHTHLVHFPMPLLTRVHLNYVLLEGDYPPRKSMASRQVAGGNKSRPHLLRSFRVTTNDNSSPAI